MPLTSCRPQGDDQVQVGPAHPSKTDCLFYPPQQGNKHCRADNSHCFTPLYVGSLIQYPGNAANEEQSVLLLRIKVAIYILMLAGSQLSPRPAQTPRQINAQNAAANSMLLQEQLERASRATETAVFRAAEAESRVAAMSAELQTARHTAQV